MGARWAAKLGYKKVVRFAPGWQGWLAHTLPPGAPPPKAKGLSIGDYFPACRLVVLKGKADRAYLGLPPGAKNFSLSEVKSDFLFVELYNELCYGCLDAVESYNHLFRLIAQDPLLSGRLKMIGLGVGSKMREVAKFRRMHQVLFPLFADKKRGVFECLGEPALPVAYLLKHEKGNGWRIMHIHSGKVLSPGQILSLLKTTLVATPP